MRAIAKPNAIRTAPVYVVVHGGLRACRQFMRYRLNAVLAQFVRRAPSHSARDYRGTIRQHRHQPRVGLLLAVFVGVAASRMLPACMQILADPEPRNPAVIHFKNDKTSASAKMARYRIAIRRCYCYSLHPISP